MNVLFASAEVVPFAKVGGLSDVVGALPKALRQQGVDARVVMPYYGFIDPQQYKIIHLFSFEFPRPTGVTDAHVYGTTLDGVQFYFVRGWPYFGEDRTVYSDWERDMPRFIFFSQVVMAVALEMKQQLDWFPDVLHVNDWHTGLIPFLLYENRSDTEWAEVASVISIHNIAHQGDNAGGWLWELGVPGRNHPDLVLQSKTNNLLGIGIAYSDIVTTVSPRYAVEIQYPYMGFGLDGLIRTRVADLYGILNGIDVERWNPDTDPMLVSNFNADNFMEKRPPNKRQLQTDAGLQVRDDVPIIGMVSRLDWQKGVDLALPALRRLLVNTDVQFIVLGTGDPDYVQQFNRLAQDFSWRARAFLEFNAAVAQHIYGGCDIFLMPSHFEPCGIGQMLAMHYGALPLVRETGGLADTVENYDNGPADRGTGFVFTWEQPEAVLATLRWAVDTYRRRPDAWRKMQRRGMDIDFSWDKSARQYIEIYENALAKRKGAATG
jgi:starch synthase